MYCMQTCVTKILQFKIKNKNSFKGGILSRELARNCFQITPLTVFLPWGIRCIFARVKHGFGSWGRWGQFKAVEKYLRTGYSFAVPLLSFLTSAGSIGI